MPKICSISTYQAPYTLTQQDAQQLTKELFQQQMPRLERLLKVFDNGGIATRQLCVSPEWHRTPHSFAERNQLYVELATQYSIEVIQQCLKNQEFLVSPIAPSDIDAIIFVSTTGLATPSVDARVMNNLPFSDRLRRIPLWGLGCAGGAAGISRAFDFCQAYPTAKVLVVCVELCSLTFQTEDVRKSNIVGASLFADGAAAVLICGDKANIELQCNMPYIIHSASKLLPNSEQVMGWDVQNSGLHVIFQKSIPAIIHSWLPSFITEFLEEQYLTERDVAHFIAHPGGKKVLEAYQQALCLTNEQTTIAQKVLQQYGNMSSPTVLYVLEQFMLQNKESNEFGMLVALGPGFCGEAVLVKWGA
ncbi:3-oxoacyl-[acyl-carrier-protein] synthase III C-terminal domain-containing protein [Metasolibacillus meyeri]|uniref:3-oxoacyl-[acyl-carrier-protein] synthase III C-terminal domain-containing protein n=1 Tax=Metasolibacillus meyeri TaxID=1071052 RepID=A0AAW9NSY0_9BACL|nr:3-oxoacyl-[acyl-carrier-protein] synthase III C-terminal domain-containing protein [Metasolibacillus meyeri]MEC1179427.1 3-oxoacyl-[acyl-carrier-protein] synthase III C-terminal domain-containing protein [Metasolibacillus meyeri]